MKRFLFSIFLCTVFLSSKAQLKEVDYEWISISGNFLYSIEDQYTGLNGKLNFPLGPGVNFVFQGTIFPSQMQNSEENFDELRAKYNIEIIPYRFKKFYVSFQTGFDYGTWRRNFSPVGTTLGENWKTQESVMFGALLNYNYKGVRFFADYMYMPQIYSNHVGIGMTLLFFESSLYRKMYLQKKVKKSNTWWKTKSKSKKSNKSNSNKG